MKTIKIAIPVILILFSITKNSYAGKIVKAKYAGEFMATGVGARALGMGGAFVAVSNDVTAGYWNPAALAQINYPQVFAMHAQRFANIVNYNYGAMAIPVGKKSSLALSLIRLGVDDIPNTQNALIDYGEDGIPNTGDAGEGNGIIDSNERLDPNKVFYFNSAEYAVYLSYGSKRSEKLFYGGNVKVIKKGIGDNSAWGMGFDFAALWRPYKRLNVGINLQDITTTLLAWDTGRNEAITPTSKIGVAYLWRSPKIAGYIIPAFDVDVRFENRRYSSQLNLGSVSFDTHVGLEYQFKQIMALRIGMDTGRFAAGIGVRLPRLQVDYAFLSHDELGDTHRISLRLTIAEKKFQRKEN